MSHVPTSDLSAALAGTTTVIWVCGLVHLNSVTVPTQVTVFALSNMAKE
jgi:hypothetical protein